MKNLVLLFMITTFLTSFKLIENDPFIKSSHQDWYPKIRGGMHCISVQYKVSDFDQWYNEHLSIKDSGITIGLEDALILQDLEYPAQVTVLYEVLHSDINHENYPDLVSSTLTGGSEENKIVSSNYFLINNSGLPQHEIFYLCKFKVISYENWKSDLISKQDLLDKFGISIISIGREHRLSNEAIVLLNAPDIKKLNSFLNCPEYLNFSTESGVQEEIKLGILKIKE